MPKPSYINLNRARDNQKFALQMLVDHGITAYRMTKDGQIAWIKHATFGWMNARTFWMLAKLKELPWEEIIEGGYRVNASIFNLPLVGPTVIIATIAAIVIAYNDQNWLMVALLTASLTMPFGAVLATYLFGETVADVGGDVLASAADGIQKLAVIWGIVNPAK